MPAWHNGLGVFVFMFTPILFLAAYFTLLGTVETKVLFLYFTFTLLHTILFTLWFFVILLDIFEGLKAENAAARRRVASTPATKKSLESGTEKAAGQLGGEDEEVHDLDEEILPGYQPDKPMTFREDMYSLLFVSLVKP